MMTVRPRDVMASVLLAGVVLSCSRSNQGQETWERVLTADSLTLERSHCFGTCPAYRLRVARSGSVLFVSRNADDSGRTATDSVSAQTYIQLLNRAQEGQLLDLPDRIEGDPRFCAVRATDFPTATVTIFMPGLIKRVEDDHGCAWTPAALRDFERAVDQVLGSERWVRPARQRP